MKRWMAFALAFGIVLVGCSSDTTTRDDAGEIIEEGDVGVFAVQVGDCVNYADGEGELVSGFEGVPCTEAHDAQLFAEFDLTGDTYPGDEVAGQQGQEGCIERFEGFVGIDYASSIYFVTSIRLTQDTWDELDDRKVLCLLVPEPGSPLLTQDLRGVAE